MQMMQRTIKVCEVTQTCLTQSWGHILIVYNLPNPPDTGLGFRPSGTANGRPVQLDTRASRCSGRQIQRERGGRAYRLSERSVELLC
jgi:hypothetical protein